MRNKVNIENLNKADVLAALYNASRPMGMGMLQAGGGPNVMDRYYADQLLTRGPDVTGDYAVGTAALRGTPKYFDYVHGRPLKVELADDTNEFDATGFDRDNGGEGAAQRVIDHLRATGDVGRADGKTFMDDTLTEEESHMYMISVLHYGKARF